MIKASESLVDQLNKVVTVKKLDKNFLDVYWLSTQEDRVIVGSSDMHYKATYAKTYNLKVLKHLQKGIIWFNLTLPGICKVSQCVI